MSHQQRSWTMSHDDQGRARWDVSINNVAVPGGYVVQLGPELFEAHYPHMTPFTRASLQEAQSRLEWAPPISAGVLQVGRPVDSDTEGFVSVEDAATELGVSVHRVRAMVSSGALSARVTANGSCEVGRSTVAHPLQPVAKHAR